MKNHMVAPSALARKVYLKPGRCGLKPAAVPQTQCFLIERLNGRKYHTMCASHDGTERTMYYLALFALDAST